MPTPTIDQIAGTVTVLNGTTSTGITKKVEDDLKAAYPGLTLLERDNAKGKAYAKTLVIDAKGTHQDAIRKIAETLKASISSLPEGEATPAADIVVIVGADRK